jgi:hypothetical protein
MSWFAFAMHYFADLEEKYPHKDTIMDMAKFYYEYAPPRLRMEAKERYTIVDFKELTKDLDGVIRSIYKRFGFKMSKEFNKIVDQEAVKSRAFTSNHPHSSGAVGIDRRELSGFFKGVIESFNST